MRKKIEKYLVYLLVVLGLLPCIGFVALMIINTPFPTSYGVAIGQSKINFKQYEMDLQKIAHDNGYTFTEEQEISHYFFDSQVLEKNFLIEKDEQSQINICISNSDRLEIYDITFTAQLETAELANNMYDMPLLIALEDYRSHKPFSLRQIQKFLKNSEEKYVDGRRDYGRPSNVLVSKRLSKALTGGGHLFYQLVETSENSFVETLTLSGEAKNLK